MAFHWLSYESLLLAKLLPSKKGKTFFFLLGSAMVRGHESSPFWPPDYFNWDFCLLIFTPLSSDGWNPRSKNEYTRSPETVPWTVLKRGQMCQVWALPCWAVWERKLLPAVEVSMHCGQHIWDWIWKFCNRFYDNRQTTNHFILSLAYIFYFEIISNLQKSSMYSAKKNKTKQNFWEWIANLMPQSSLKTFVYFLQAMTWP